MASGEGGSGVSSTVVQGHLVVYGGAAANKVWLLNLATHKWTERLTGGAVPPARLYHTASAWNGDMLVYGGTLVDPEEQASLRLAGLSGEASPPLYLWSMQTGMWTAVESSGEHPGARSHHSAVVMDGMLVVFGGRTLKQNPTVRDLEEDKRRGFFDVFVLDIRTRIWHRVEKYDPSAPMLWGHAAASFRHYMIVTGGFSVAESTPQLPAAAATPQPLVPTGGGDADADTAPPVAALSECVYVWDLNRCEWKKASPHLNQPRPLPRALHAAHVVGASVVIVGGITVDPATGRPTSVLDAWLWDISSGYWSPFQLPIQYWSGKKPLSGTVQDGGVLLVATNQHEVHYYDVPRQRGWFTTQCDPSRLYEPPETPAALVHSAVGSMYMVQPQHEVLEAVVQVPSALSPHSTPAMHPADATPYTGTATGTQTDPAPRVQHAVNWQQTTPEGSLVDPQEHHIHQGGEMPAASTPPAPNGYEAVARRLPFAAPHQAQLDAQEQELRDERVNALKQQIQAMRDQVQTLTQVKTALNQQPPMPKEHPQVSPARHRPVPPAVAEDGPGQDIAQMEILQLAEQLRVVQLENQNFMQEAYAKHRQQMEESKRLHAERLAAIRREQEQQQDTQLGLAVQEEEVANAELLRQQLHLLRRQQANIAEAQNIAPPVDAASPSKGGTEDTEDAIPSGVQAMADALTKLHATFTRPLPQGEQQQQQQQPPRAASAGSRERSAIPEVRGIQDALDRLQAMAPDTPSEHEHKSPRRPERLVMPCGGVGPRAFAAEPAAAAANANHVPPHIHGLRAQLQSIDRSVGVPHGVGEGGSGSGAGGRPGVSPPRPYRQVFASDQSRSLPRAGGGGGGDDRDTLQSLTPSLSMSASTKQSRFHSPLDERGWQTTAPSPDAMRALLAEAQRLT